MFKKLFCLILITSLLCLPAPVLADSSQNSGQQEVVVGKFIFEGYWDIWGANGTWVGVRPGQKNLSCESDAVYVAGFTDPNAQGLQKILQNYKLTRAEVKYAYPFGEAEYNDAGKRYGRPWKIGFSAGFYYEDYRTMPDDLRAEIKSFDSQTGATVVKWTFDYPQKLNPDFDTPPKGPESSAANITTWLKFGLWNKIDFRFISRQQAEAIRNNSTLEGWRVYFPAIVWWYGIPKSQVDISVRSDKDVYTGAPGSTVNIIAAVKNEGAASTITDFGARWQSDDWSKKIFSRTNINLNPGDDPHYTVPVTVPTAERKLVLQANIDGNTPPNEASLDNNIKIVSIRPVDPCTDISVRLRVAPSTVNENEPATLTATVTRANDGPDRAVTVKAVIDGPVEGSTAKTAVLAKGQSKSLSWTTRKFGRNQTITFKVTAAPTDAEDCKPGNNTATATLSVTGPVEVTPADSDFWVEIIR